MARVVARALEEGDISAANGCSFQRRVAFTKNQILQQSGVAMLAQANQAPQAILQLLR